MGRVQDSHRKRSEVTTWYILLLGLTRWNTLVQEGRLDIRLLRVLDGQAVHQYCICVIMLRVPQP